MDTTLERRSVKLADGREVVVTGPVRKIAEQKTSHHSLRNRYLTRSPGWDSYLRSDGGKVRRLPGADEMMDRLFD